MRFFTVPPTIPAETETPFRNKVQIPNFPTAHQTYRDLWPLARLGPHCTQVKHIVRALAGLFCTEISFPIADTCNASIGLLENAEKTKT